MLALYLWTYASSILALIAFLELRAAALWGRSEWALSPYHWR